MTWYLSAAHSQRTADGYPLPVLAGELRRVPAEAPAVYADALGALTRRLTDQLGKLGRPDPESLAGSALAEMVGAVALARALLDPADAEAILARSRPAVLDRLGLRDVAGAAR